MHRFGRCPGNPQTRRGSVLRGPALGYLAQVDYALLSAALERMDDEDDFALSLETLSDDIVFITPRPTTRPRSGRANT